MLSHSTIFPIGQFQSDANKRYMEEMACNILQNCKNNWNYLLLSLWM